MLAHQPIAMKAIVVDSFGPPENLIVRNIPALVPGPGQVLVALSSAGVNPVETYQRSGNYAKLPSLPWTPGKDGAGTVEAVGEGVTRVAPGARVWLAGSVTGTYASHCLVAEADAVPLPAHVPLAAGAALGSSYLTAWRALAAAGCAAGKSVFVHGASGGVGLAAVQLARFLGATPIIGSASTAAGRAAVIDAGASLAVDHSADDVVRAVLDGTGQAGADVVVEMLMDKNAAADMALVARGGTIAVVGNRGSADGVNFRALMQREARIVGVMLAGATAEEKAAAIAAITAGLERGVLTPKVNAAAAFPLEAAAAAHVEVIEHARGTAGKVTLAL